MATEQIITIVFTALITGGFSAITTVGALRVHITYLKEGQSRNEKAILRAHERIDGTEKRLFSSGVAPR